MGKVQGCTNPPNNFYGFFQGNGWRVRDEWREGTSWLVADARDPELAQRVGCFDLVVVDNVLIHMDRESAEACLENLAGMALPGGHVSVSGVDLDVRTRVARRLGLAPVLDRLVELHEGDLPMRRDWPWRYWGLEPLDRRHRDWPLRYASIFCVPR